jgi:iron complex outermembrane receptor protein
MRNKGIELALNARVLDRGSDGLRWDASFNAARNTNRLLTINPLAGGVSQILTGGINGGVGNNIQVLKPGYSVNSFFVYRHKRDADGTPVYADVDGDGDIDDTDLYVDVNDDGVVNQDDRTPFESPAATWILGHTSNLAFRDFDLGFTLRANLGNYVYNNVASSLGFYDALKGGAPTNLHASVLENGFGKPQYFSDVYVEDASYLRMDNLTLGYTFHQLRQVDEVRVFGTVQNVFTVTDYSGVDPSAGLNGIDNNIYPRSRTFSLGVTLGF